MSDFRTELYERYVSTFKGAAEKDTPEVGRASEFSAAYSEWCRFKYLPLFRDLPKDCPILELGCGPGDMLDFLGQNGFSAVEGIDIAPEQVRIASERGLNARVADVLECLEAAPNRYHVILAIDFVEHFSKDELMRLVPAIRGALQPGGHLILQTPNGEGLFPSQVIYGDLTHLTIFTPASTKQLFRLWGFEDFRFVETGPVPAGLVGRLRVLIWRMITLSVNLMRKIETGKTQAIWSETFICRCTKTDA